MKRQISFSILAAALAVLVLSFFPEMEMKAAGTATLNSAVIQGDQVVVTGTSSIVSEDGICMRRIHMNPAYRASKSPRPRTAPYPFSFL